MGFSWTPINVGDKTKADHYNEVKTNIDTVYSDLALTPRSWTEFPVSVSNHIRSAESQELRTAIDYADDQNYCRDHNGTYHAPVDSVDKEGVDASYDLAIYSGEETGYNPVHDAGIDSDHDEGYDANHCPGYCIGYNQGVDADYRGTNKFTNDADDHTTYYRLDNANYQTAVNPAAHQLYQSYNYISVRIDVGG